MPYTIRKIPNKDLYKVFNTDTKSIHSYSTTLENAKKQVNLLEGIKEGGKNLAQPLSKGEGIDNPELYEKAKEEVYKQYPKHSAYRSGQLVKKYKEMGGTYSGKKPKSGLTRWFKENWEDIGSTFGKSRAKDEKMYPVYRPTIRVNKDTPLTPDEIKPSNLKKQIALKQVIKGDSNLPPFVGSGIAIDKTSNDIKRITLTDSAKQFLDDKLLPIISKTTINITNTRTNSGRGRSQPYGYGMIRGKGFGEFKNNTRHPELWNALVKFGSKLVPDYIPWTTIQVNHNYKSKKHIDGNNMGLSLAVSFGDFTGGELVIEDKEYQTKLHPIIFNGALKEHFNKPITGNRYSLVYFVSAPKTYNDEQIFKLHNKIKEKEGGSIETDLFETGGVVSIPEFRSVTLDLPTYMFKRLPDMKGKPPPYRYRLVIPITKSRNLSSRKLETSLNISQKAVDKPIVSVKEIDDSEKPLLEEFSPEDRDKIKAYYENIKTAEKRKLSPDDIEKDRYEIKQRGLPCYLYENCRKSGVNFKENKKQPKKKIVKEKMGVIPYPDDDYVYVGNRGTKKNPYYDEVVYPKPKPDLFAALVRSSKNTDSEPSVNASSKSSSEPRTIASKTSTKISKDLVPAERRGVIDAPPKASKKKGNVAEKVANIEKSGKGLTEENKILSNSKMPNKWITYVKQYASKNGISYSDALKDPKCTAGYTKGSVANKTGSGINKTFHTQDLVADLYNDSELGANAGKKYISL